VVLDHGIGIFFASNIAAFKKQVKCFPRTTRVFRTVGNASFDNAILKDVIVECDGFRLPEYLDEFGYIVGRERNFFSQKLERTFELN